MPKAQLLTLLVVAGAWTIPLANQNTAPAQSPDDCVWECYLAEACMETPDEYCPGCDPLGSDTCTGVAKDTNPGELVIEIAAAGYGDKVMEYQDDVICYSQQQCGEGSWILYNICSSSTACTRAPWVVSGCQACGPTGTVDNFIVEDERCLDCPYGL